MTLAETTQKARSVLQGQGFAVLRSAIDPSIIRRMLQGAESVKPLLGTETSSPAYGYPLVIADILEVVQHAAKTLRGMGARPTIKAAVLVPKNPGEVRRNWHIDTGNVSPVNGMKGAPLPENVMLMYYLQDTGLDNGCLVVLPIQNSADAKGNRPIAGEVAVPINAGDVVVVNPRLVHAALQNKTKDMRFMIRLRFDCEWSHA